ncbi:MAG: Rho termination factor N-terminal domain-containing protein, partial [Anaerolineaceae bacterium]
MKIVELENAPLATLRDMAKGLNVPNAARLKKENLLIKIRQVEAEKEGLEVRG